MLLKDKVAIVTGAGAGIGKAIALRYAREGADVVVAEINEETGPQTAAEVTALGRRGLFVKTDVAKVSEINAMVAKTVETFGKIDILVNDATYTDYFDFFELTEETWDLILSIAAKGTFFCMQAVAREMVKNKSGKIITIASIAAKGFRLSSNLAYSAAKGAQISMTRTAALQLAPHNINVNAICPGPTRTGGIYHRVKNEIMKRENMTEEKALAELYSFIPLKRSSSGDDIANMAAFLASDEAGMITGQSYNVDGGLIFD